MPDQPLFNATNSSVREINIWSQDETDNSIMTISLERSSNPKKKNKLTFVRRKYLAVTFNSRIVIHLKLCGDEKIALTRSSFYQFDDANL